MSLLCSALQNYDSRRCGPDNNVFLEGVMMVSIENGPPSRSFPASPPSFKRGIWMAPSDGSKQEPDPPWPELTLEQQHQQGLARSFSTPVDIAAKSEPDVLSSQLSLQFSSQLSLQGRSPLQSPHAGGGGLPLGSPHRRPAHPILYSLSLGGGGVSPHDPTRARMDARLGQAMQSLEMQRLRRELDGPAGHQVDPNSEMSYLRSEISRTRHLRAERHAEVAHLRRNSETGMDPLTDLGVEIACLRGEVQGAREIHTEQQLEMNRLRREIDYLSAAKAEQTVELGRMRHLMENMTSFDIMQLEDYTIRALQMDLKAESRRGIAGPDAMLMNAPDEYTGCRQFFQSGFCHFGRGRRPCPNENTHFCTECGRSHGTAPHRILLCRLSDRTLNAGI